MGVRWPPALLGLSIAISLLAFVTRFSFFGVTCYAIDDLNVFGETRCLPPLIYWGAWAVAIVFLLLAIRRSSSESQDSAAQRFRSDLVLTLAVLVVIAALSAGGYWYYTTEIEQAEGPAPAQTQPGAATGRATAPEYNPPPMPSEPSPPAIGPDGLPISPPPAIGPDGLPIPPADSAPPPTAADPTGPATPNPLPVAGQLRWAGQGTESNGRTVAVTVIFDPSGNADIAWPDNECGGTLTFTAKVDASFRYRENITYGSDKCVAQATVTLTPIENGAAISMLEEAGSGTSVTATLRPF